MKKLLLLCLLISLSGCVTTGNVGEKGYKVPQNTHLIHGALEMVGLGGDLFFIDIWRENRRDWAMTKVEKFCPNYQTVAESKRNGNDPLLFFICPDLAKPTVKIKSLGEGDLEITSILDSELIYNFNNSVEIAKLICNPYGSSPNWDNYFEILDQEKNQESNYKLSFRCSKEDDDITYRKLKKEEEKIKNQNSAQEIAEEEKAKEVALLESINAKRELCFSMGFEENTDPLANCVLQLMLDENKKQQVVVSNDSSSDEMLDVLDNQTQIMERQLRLQKIERNQRNMKSFQYMIDNGALPPGGFGN